MYKIIATKRVWPRRIEIRAEGITRKDAAQQLRQKYLDHLYDFYQFDSLSMATDALKHALDCEGKDIAVYLMEKRFEVFEDNGIDQG